MSLLKRIVIITALLILSILQTIPLVTADELHTTLYIHIFPLSKRLPEKLLTQVSDQFASLGIKVAYIDTRDEMYRFYDEISGPTITIQLGIWDGESELEVGMYENHVFALEPGLAGSFGWQTLMPFSSSDLSDEVQTLNIILGMGLYALNDCKRSTQYLVSGNDDEVFDRELQRSIQFYLGNCAAGEQDYFKAQQYFLASIPYQSHRLYQYPSAVYNVAWTHYHTNDTDNGLDLLNRLVDSANQFSTPWGHTYQIEALIVRAQFKALIFDYLGAVNDLSTAIEYDPFRASLYVERGKASILLYEWDRVLADYDYAIELEPTYSDAYFYRGILYYSVLAREEALSDFETYLELNPHGEHAGEATRYAESIHTELEALSAP